MKTTYGKDREKGKKRTNTKYKYIILIMEEISNEADLEKKLIN